MSRKQRRSNARRLNRRDKQAAVGSGAALLLIALVLVGGGIPDTESAPIDTCDDGIDNDSDGWTDQDDPECNPLSPSYDGVEDGDA